MMMKRTTAIGLLAVMGIFFSSVAMSAELKDFNFGEILAMSGSGSWYGTTMERGTKIAIEEINSGGGAAGYKLVAFVEDHKSGLSTPAQNAFMKLTSIH